MSATCSGVMIMVEVLLRCEHCSRNVYKRVDKARFYSLTVCGNYLYECPDCRIALDVMWDSIEVIEYLRPEEIGENDDSQNQVDHDGLSDELSSDVASSGGDEDFDESSLFGDDDDTDGTGGLGGDGSDWESVSDGTDPELQDDVNLMPDARGVVLPTLFEVELPVDEGMHRFCQNLQGSSGEMDLDVSSVE